MSELEPTIRVRVDPTNPGQFFACCGLSELADRLWGGAEGWFDHDGCHYHVRATGIGSSPHRSPAAFAEELARCPLTNAMTDAQLARRVQLASMPKRMREASSLEAEKKALDASWREEPVLVGEPFCLRLDWFVDGRAGGSALKTWAGQQSVIDIALGMRAAAEDALRMAPENWLRTSTKSAALSFNFDGALGAIGSDRDVGFSFDPLKGITVQTRPVLELLAFVGLQRFRPLRIASENRYRFSLWFHPLVPEVASAAACGLLGSAGGRTFEFRLLYRTKYLKSFLPARRCER